MMSSESKNVCEMFTCMFLKKNNNCTLPTISKHSKGTVTLVKKVHSKLCSNA